MSGVIPGTTGHQVADAQYGDNPVEAAYLPLVAWLAGGDVVIYDDGAVP
jgi:hypothetical protein